MKRILILLAVATIVGCTDSRGAYKALDQAGFTKIQTGGYAVFGCGQDDDYATKFTAVNPKGYQVSGVVCGGFLKGSTIRY